MVYQVSRSAFSYLEKPLVYSESLLFDKTETLKKRTLGYVSGLFFYPIACASIPITILADIVVGVTETVFCFFKRMAFSDIKEILQRKIIIASVQQLVFLSLPIAFYVFAVGFHLEFCISIYLLWPALDIGGKFCVSSFLPKCFNFQKMCVFSTEPCFSIIEKASYKVKKI